MILDHKIKKAPKFNLTTPVEGEDKYINDYYKSIKTTVDLFCFKKHETFYKTDLMQVALLKALDLYRKNHADPYKMKWAYVSFAIKNELLVKYLVYKSPVNSENFTDRIDIDSTEELEAMPEAEREDTWSIKIDYIKTLVEKENCSEEIKTKILKYLDLNLPCKVNNSEYQSVLGRIKTLIKKDRSAGNEFPE